MRHLGRCRKTTRIEGPPRKGTPTALKRAIANGKLLATERWDCAFECPVRRCRQTHGDLPPYEAVCPKCGEEIRR